MKESNNEKKKSKKASLPVRMVLVIAMFVFALMLTVGYFVPGSPLSTTNLASASGGSSGGFAPEMRLIVIPLFFWMSYKAGKEIVKEVKAKKKEAKPNGFRK